MALRNLRVSDAGGSIGKLTPSVVTITAIPNVTTTPTIITTTNNVPTIIRNITDTPIAQPTIIRNITDTPIAQPTPTVTQTTIPNNFNLGIGPVSIPSLPTATIITTPIVNNTISNSQIKVAKTIAELRDGDISSNTIERTDLPIYSAPIVTTPKTSDINKIDIKQSIAELRDGDTNNKIEKPAIYKAPTINNTQSNDMLIEGTGLYPGMFKGTSENIPVTDAGESKTTVTTTTENVVKSVNDMLIKGTGLFLDMFHGLFRNNQTPHTTTMTTTTKPADEPVILTQIGATVDKTAVTDMKIDNSYFKLFNLTQADNRKLTATKFSFEYLSFLFFETDINKPLPNFYNAIESMIKDDNNGTFNRAEDMLDADVAEEDVIDDKLTKLIFNKIWSVAKLNSVGVMNLIGFYIYFNRRLRFLPILIQGTSLNDFIANMTIESIIGKLLALGLYPVSGTNLFDRIWNSYVYSIQENANKATIKMSLREYYNYDITRNMAETYNGFANPYDKLIILYDLDMRKWGNNKTFNTQSAAFNRFKELSLAYIADDTNHTYLIDGSDPIEYYTDIKEYLLDLLPNAKSVYMRKSLMNDSSNTQAPDRNLWSTLQSFDDVFKINKLEINKSIIRSLFVEFANDDSFPVAYTDAIDFDSIWTYWITYLNSKASSITARLLTAIDADHDYTNIYNQLVWLVNAKYIIQYLEVNNSLPDGYTDGAEYMNAAILKVYGSLTALKTQMKDIINYITVTDRRFYSASAKQ